MLTTTTSDTSKSAILFRLYDAGYISWDELMILAQDNVANHYTYPGFPSTPFTFTNGTGTIHQRYTNEQ